MTSPCVFFVTKGPNSYFAPPAKTLRWWEPPLSATTCRWSSKYLGAKGALCAEGQRCDGSFRRGTERLMDTLRECCVCCPIDLQLAGRPIWELAVGYLIWYCQTLYVGHDIKWLQTFEEGTILLEAIALYGNMGSHFWCLHSLPKAQLPQPKSLKSGGLAPLLEDYEQHRATGQGRDCVVPWQLGIPGMAGKFLSSFKGSFQGWKVSISFDFTELMQIYEP